MLLIFIAAVGVSLVLERQERRHFLEKSLEYSRLGWKIPRIPPRISRLEGWVNAVFGIMLLGSGIWLSWIMIRSPHPESGATAFELLALMMAAGAALMLLGRKALSQNRQYRRTSQEDLIK